MTISDISVRRPVFAAVLAILMILVGVVGFMSLPVREYPDTETADCVGGHNLHGAAATVVETVSRRFSRTLWPASRAFKR